MPHICFLLFMSTNTALVLAPSHCSPPPWSVRTQFLPSTQGHHSCLLTWQIRWCYTFRAGSGFMLTSCAPSCTIMSPPRICMHTQCFIPLTSPNMQWSYFFTPSYPLFPLSGTPFPPFAMHHLHIHFLGPFSAFPNPSRWSNILLCSPEN